MSKSDVLPGRCACGKVRWPSEEAAAAAAARTAEGARAYRCSGRQWWHIATRGYAPESLRSWCRIVAWSVRRAGRIRRCDLAAEVARLSAELTDVPGGWSWSKGRRRDFRYDIAALIQLGLVEVDGDEFVAADPDGLARVCEVGVAGVRADRGVAWQPIPDDVGDVATLLRRAVEDRQGSL